MKQNRDEGMGLPRGSAHHSVWLAWVLLAAGLIITVLVTLYMKSHMDAMAKEEFAFSCDEIRLRIDDRLNDSEQILRSGVAFFDSSEVVTRDGWRSFTGGLNLGQRFPGIQGIGFALLIPRGRLAQHLQDIRAEGFPEYQVRPEGERETYSSIIYLEPFSGRNLRAFGYDMFSEPVRRAAMERARDQGAAALSGKVILVQETKTDVQAGTLMYVPAYRRGMPTATVEQRRAAIQGWVYSPYRMNDLMLGILGARDLQEGKRTRLQVYDGELASPDTLLYDSQAAGEKEPAPAPRFSLQVPIDVAGHRWTLRFTHTGGQTFAAEFSRVWLVFFGGTIVSLLLFGLILSLLNTRFIAQRIAEQLTAELQQNQELLTVNNKLLQLSLEDVGIEQILDQSLKLILGIDWLAFEDRGAIFLRRKNDGDFAMAAQSNLAEPIRRACATIRPGHCMCGLAASTGTVQFANNLDERHTVSYPGILPHGHYCVPILMAGNVLGVINIYLRPGHRRDPVEEDFLKAVANTLAGIITRKRAEGAIIEYAEQYRTILSTALFGFWLVDENGKLLDVNDAYCKMSRYTREELLNLSVPDLEVIESPEDTARHIQKVIETGTDQFESKHKTKDGRVFDVEISSGFLYSQKRLVVFIRDITERKRAEEKIKYQRNTLSAIYESSPYIIALVDQDGKLININKAGVEFAGRGKDVLLGRLGGEVFNCLNSFDGLGCGRNAVCDDCPIRSRVMSTLRTGESIKDAEGRMRLLVGGGEVERDLLVSTNLVKQGDSDRVLITIVDITERKQAEEQIQRQLQYIAALHEIDRAITGSVDMRLTLKIILEQVMEHLKVDAAAILLLNPHTMTLEYSAGLGFRGRDIERSRLRLGEGHAGHAALERCRVHIPDLRERKEEFLRADLLKGEEFVTYFAFPLIAKGQVAGVLETFHRSLVEPGEEWLNFFETLAGQTAIAIDSIHLFDGLQRSNVELVKAYDATIEGWSRALDLRDKETEGHTQRVTEMTERLTRAMGISEAEIVHIHRGALLHDIGKMGVPDSILLKPDKLTDEEWVLMRQHPQHAFEMLSSISYLRPALDIPGCHHEKWDGTGYPRGLKGEQIPLAARLFAVVDVWDALRSDRPYRKGWPEEKVLEHIRSLAGTHFDPKAVDLFLRVVSEKTEKH